MKRKAFLVLLIAFLSVFSLQANPYRGPIGLCIIDAGHGGKDPGALSDELEEKEITLAVAKALAAALVKKGALVAMTRSDDSYLSLEERCSIARSASFSFGTHPVFVSIHVNSSKNTQASGFEVFTKIVGKTVPMLAEDSSYANVVTYASYTNAQLNAFLDSSNKALVQNVLLSLESAFPEAQSRGIKEEDFYVVNGTYMPSVLVEIGFISNKEDRSKLCSDLWQQRMADAIADALYP